jgi:hypothetical protein
MDWLANKGFRPLPLAEAVTRLQERTLLRAVVLAFDFGWFGCLYCSFSKLKALWLSVTFYVTTYYSQHRDPVFNVAVRYLLWKSTLKVLDLATVHEGLQGLIHLSTAAERSRTAHKVSEFALSKLTRDERRHLLYALAQRLTSTRSTPLSVDG